MNITPQLCEVAADLLRELGKILGPDLVVKVDRNGIDIQVPSSSASEAHRVTVLIDVARHFEHRTAPHFSPFLPNPASNLAGSWEVADEFAEVPVRIWTPLSADPLPFGKTATEIVANIDRGRENRDEFWADMERDVAGDAA